MGRVVGVENKRDYSKYNDWEILSNLHYQIYITFRKEQWFSLVVNIFNTQFLLYNEAAAVVRYLCNDKLIIFTEF